MTDHQGAWNTTHLRIGDQMQVSAYKSDGTCYRWWTATVESVAADRLALVTPVGHPIEDPGGGIDGRNLYGELIFQFRLDFSYILHHDIVSQITEIGDKTERPES